MTAIARSLWSCGLTVLLANHLGEQLPNEMKAIAKAIPIVEDTPKGSKLLKFGVLERDLERIRKLAKINNKKPAELNRDALAIGVWVHERIGVIRAMADELSSPE